MKNLIAVCILTCVLCTPCMLWAQEEATSTDEWLAAYERGAQSAEETLDTLLTMADQAYYRYDYPLLEELLTASFPLTKKIADQQLLGRFRWLRAECKMNTGDRAGAVELLQQSMRDFQAAGDSIRYVEVLRRMANNHDYLGNHENAIKLYEECLQLAEELEHWKLKAAVFDNLGGLYSEEGNFEKSFEYYLQAEELARSIGYSRRLRSILHGVAIAHRFQGNEAKSLEYTLKMGAETVNLKDSGFYYQCLAAHHLRFGPNYNASEKYALKALEIGQKIKNEQLRTNAYDKLEQIYYATGRYKDAYHVAKTLHAESDSLYNLENTKLIETINAQYQTEKSERELAEKNQQLQQATYQVERQERNLFIMGMMAVLLLAIVFLVYRGYVLRKRSEALLRVKNDEIQRHVDQVENVNATKSRWFVNVAHELRTPLTLIAGPIRRVLSNYDLPGEVREDLKLVDRNTNSLTGLVNEILDLSKLEAGKMALREEVVDLKALVVHLVEGFESRAVQLGVSLHVDICDEVALQADRDKLTKLLINLISNALKFTPAGGDVQVSVRRFEEEVIVAVQDSGHGIRKEDLPYIFERFYQSSDPNVEASGGTGIGLALSREIALMHEGELSVTSEVGKGSTFRLALPASRVTSQVKAAPDQTTIAPNEEVRLPSTADNPTLLLVEDNSDMRSYIGRLLADQFEVLEAGNGLQGLEVLKEKSVRFIISDVMMPEMDGISFLKEVKAHAKWKHIPFVHLSALSDTEMRKEALRIGIDDFLMKPFDPEELIIRVQNLYENYLSRVAHQEDADEHVSYEDRMLSRLREEVLANLDDSHFNVLRLADAAAMSERQLYRYLKAHTGLTPNRFIQEIKLNKAIELAENKVYVSTAELASALGFKQASYFSTLFEKRFGRKPTAILKEQ
ncbi:ATP-binding protein [Marinoscillum furvescens]|uniref:ATP-binding protein n=1 Tax=Marinoscillum furvescens TaxID=1026 RepID=UPI001C869714|nr:ATP-binding protein [Marinoscillum furvescens]